MVPEQNTGGELHRHPYPGYFAKRGWISLRRKHLTFLAEQKSLQFAGNKRDNSV
jgi:hypothetical protein